MIDEVKVRARKSAKYGKTYEYRFEVAPIGGEQNGTAKVDYCLRRKHGRLGLKN